MAYVYGTDNSETLDNADGVTNDGDVIFGYGGNDSIFGLGGNDLILGGGGADYIIGGAGTDAAAYLDSWEGVVVSLVSGAGYGGTAEGDTLSGIENLVGSLYDDFLVGNDGNNMLNGHEGDDILNGGGGADTLYGGYGNDTLKGGGGADTLYGGTGINTADYFDSPAGVFISLHSGVGAYGDAEGDQLYNIGNAAGSAYDDDLWGNFGDNVLTGRDGEDTLKGFGGDDTLYGGDDNDGLFGMDGADILYGENGNDTLYGQDGNDMLLGGAGGDTMIGGFGNDTYYVDNAGDVVTELAGEGTDKVFASIGHTLAPNVENLELTAAAGAAFGAGNALGNQIVGNSFANTLNGLGGNDVVSGGGGADLIYGEAGDDILLGGSGDDVLIGGADIDTLTGGTGNDTFFFALGDGGNYVTDFVAGDASGDVVSLQGFGWDSFDDVVMGQSGADVVIFYDVNNQILLQNVNLANLNAGDFLFS